MCPKNIEHPLLALPLSLLDKYFIFQTRFLVALTGRSTRNPLWFHNGFSLRNPPMVSFKALFLVSAAHTQTHHSNCLLLDSCPGHTGGPYGKQENVSLKFNYLPHACITFCCFIWVMCCKPQGARVLFPNSPTAAPLTVCARTALHMRCRLHSYAGFFKYGRKMVVWYKHISNRS